MALEFNERAGCQEYFSKAHAMVRRSVRDFVKKESLPNIDDWEEQGEFPLGLYAKAGEVGILGIGYPEELGGTPGDLFFKVAASEELMRSGSGGLVAGLGSLDIAIPPIIRHGTDEQKERFVKPVLAGKKIAALGITEQTDAVALVVSEESGAISLAVGSTIASRIEDMRFGRQLASGAWGYSTKLRSGGDVSMTLMSPGNGGASASESPPCLAV